MQKNDMWLQLSGILIAIKNGLSDTNLNLERGYTVIFR